MATSKINLPLTKLFKQVTAGGSETFNVLGEWNMIFLAHQTTARRGLYAIYLEYVMPIIEASEASITVSGTTFTVTNTGSGTLNVFII